MKKLIIYDLDGTLVDTRHDIVDAANHMVEAMGGETLSFEAVCGYVGWGLHDLVGKCLRTTDPEKIRRGGEIFRRYYSEHMLDSSALYPGALEVLEYFKTRKQAVITNKPNPFSQSMLEKLGVARYFTDIVAGNSNYPQKPNPEALLAIMKREGILAQETLFIGDSLIDIETGKNALIQTVVLTHGFVGENELKSARPDFLTENFESLLACARKEGW
jgi:phosphoglycolate phosphatase